MPARLTVVPRPLRHGSEADRGSDRQSDAAVALVESLVALQSVATRDELLDWATTHLRPRIGYRAMACLLAEPHRSGFVIRDVIASDDAIDCLVAIEGETASTRDDARRRREADIVDASRAVIDHWMRDRCALQMGIAGSSTQEEESRVGPLLACFDVDAVAVHGVREAFSGGATFLIVGVDTGTGGARRTLDTLTLIMPTLHVARQRIHRTERANAMPGPSIGLTPREQTILKLIAEGHTDEETAKAVGRSVHTIKNQVRHLVAKLGARNRTQAVYIAGQHDLLAAALPADAAPN